MSPLESLSQQIHATLLSPPAKFLLTSKRAVDDQWWRLRLFWNGGGDSKAGVRVWTADINLEEVSVLRSLSPHTSFHSAIAFLFVLYIPPYIIIIAPDHPCCVLCC